MTLRFHLTPVRMPGGAKQLTTNAREDLEKGTLIHCWWGCKVAQMLWK